MAKAPIFKQWPPPGVQFWNDPAPAARTLREYVELQRSARRAARTSASQIVAQYRQAAGPDFAAALEAGASLGATASSVGGALGPVGIVGGAIAGFLGGVVAGIIPTERNAAEARWNALLVRLRPIERYAVLPATRPIALRNAQAEGMTLPGAIDDAIGPWRWANDPLLGHSPWGGPVGRTVNLIEQVFRYPIVPSQCASDTQDQREYVALWLLLFAAGAHDDGKRPGQMMTLWPLLSEGPAMGPVRAEMLRVISSGRGGPFDQRTLGELRTLARARRITSIWNPPITPGIRAALESAR